MKTIKENELLGRCNLCKESIFQNDSWFNETSIVINAVWLCGECLANLWGATTEALKRYKASIKDNKTPMEKIATKYGISVAPETGKLKKRKPLNRPKVLGSSKE